MKGKKNYLSITKYAIRSPFEESLCFNSNVQFLHSIFKVHTSTTEATVRFIGVSLYLEFDFHSLFSVVN